MSLPTPPCSDSALWKRFSDRQARIGVVGLGYVGLPLLLSLAQSGFPVTGFDCNSAHLERLTSGESPFTHIPDAAVAALAGGDCLLTGDMSQAAELDAVILCLPTPLTQQHEPDLSYVTASVRALLPHLHAGMLVCLESTTWPGTTEEVLLPLIESTGLVVGRDIYLAFSPEREDPGNPHFSQRHIPKLVSGVTPDCLEHALALYRQVMDRVVPVSSTRTAEFTKLLENIQRSVNIGLMNEMKIAARAMGVDIFEAIAAASTKPFGFTPYYPGPGLGGHCIPIDPFYLSWKARQCGVETRFIELAGTINRHMPDYVVDGLIKELEASKGTAISKARLLIVGMAYKPDINDIRESPALAIMERLQEHGAALAYFDPYVPVVPGTRHYPHFAGMTSADPASAPPRHYDAAIIVTHHRILDYPAIGRASRLIIDTRGSIKTPVLEGASVCHY